MERRAFLGNVMLCLISATVCLPWICGCGDGGPNHHGYFGQPAACDTADAESSRYRGSHTPRLQPMPNIRNESYDHEPDNRFRRVQVNPLSTFSIDVDTASYSNVRRFIDQGQLPPIEAVRVEEMVNYFNYRYDPPMGEDPFSVNVEISECPWQTGHQLARIGLCGKTVKRKERGQANLVFLIDVSGSMQSSNKLPLVKDALMMLVDELRKMDRVSIAVYAGSAGVVLEPTECREREQIVRAIDRLHAGGSTAGAAGIRQAYALADQSFVRDGINRVIICTDGDFNVGITDQSELVRLIKKKADGGVFLNVLGFGMGNLKDSTLEKLADNGNGSYAYIDSRQEARKVMVEQSESTLVTIAKDVKIQVDFNPEHVDSYRLIGYENRVMENRDFANDRKDAGEIGAGHTVTAFYELVPCDVGSRDSGHDRSEPTSRYRDPNEPDRSQRTADRTASREGEQTAISNEMFTVSIRYKEPNAGRSELLEFPVRADAIRGGPTSEYQFASAVACFGMMLRESRYQGDANYKKVIRLAESGRGNNPNGHRGEFIRLVERARALR